MISITRLFYGFAYIFMSLKPVVNIITINHYGYEVLITYPCVTHNSLLSKHSSISNSKKRVIIYETQGTMLLIFYHFKLIETSEKGHLPEKLLRELSANNRECFGQLNQSVCVCCVNVIGPIFITPASWHGVLIDVTNTHNSRGHLASKNPTFHTFTVKSAHQRHVITSR